MAYKKMKRILTGISLSIFFISNAVHSEQLKPVLSDLSISCSQDLAYLPEFLLLNDAGANDNRKYRGESLIAEAYDRAQREIALVTTKGECEKIIGRYLATWREGHLDLESAIKVPEKDQPIITASHSKDQLTGIHWLSKKTVLMTFPTFMPEAEKPILELFKTHKNRLKRTPNWIIDVRKNNGGSDSTYQPITEAVIGNSIHIQNTEYLATQANIEGTLKVCEIHAPGDYSCLKWATALADAMRAAPNGTYVRHPESKNALFRDEPNPTKSKRPEKVVVLIDSSCGSSCEQFLLAMRQSWNVKLMGRRTYGALDYSNLRPHKLPSGQRVLWYATSRSLRLPHLPVDAVGVLPDVLLPPPANDADRLKEVNYVPALLEGRSIALPSW
jgi:hypothetical protein